MFEQMSYTTLQKTTKETTKATRAVQQVTRNKYRPNCVIVSEIYHTTYVPELVNLHQCYEVSTLSLTQV